MGCVNLIQELQRICNVALMGHDLDLPTQLTWMDPFDMHADVSSPQLSLIIN